MKDETRMHDISRLYEALGIDPISYVNFGKHPGNSRSNRASSQLPRIASGRNDVA